MSRSLQNFEFSKTTTPEGTTFTGYAFYNIYKNSEFMRNSENIETILARGYELRQKLKNVAPGECVKINGMCLERNTPLLVKRTGPNIKVEDYEFTQNRLTGLVAAYAFENRLRFPIIKSSEAETLGMTWDNQDEEKCRLYLSAVTGTEHFVDQFTFFPLICALRKLQLNKMTLEPVLKIAKIKNSSGERMSEVFLLNYNTVIRLWKYFPGSKATDLPAMLAVAPPQLKKLFEMKK